MTVADKHRDLYSRIPSFECVEGCNECCGSIPAYSSWEWENVPEKKATVNFYCPYKTATGCGNYENRFLICRLFGAVEGFECPKAGKFEGMLTREEGDQIMKEYFEIMEEVV